MKSVDLLKNKGVMNFTLMFLLIIVYSFLQGILFEYVFKNIVGYNIISVLCSYIFSAVILLFFVKYFEKTTFEYFGFSKENNLEAIKVGAGLAIFSIVGVVAILLMSNNISLSLSKDLKIGIIIILTMLVLMQGFLEEVVFRGYLMTRLAAKKGKWIAILLSSLFYLVFRMSNPTTSKIDLLNIFLISVVMSLLYWYFDNVLVIAIFHAFWNCISGLVFGFNLSGIKLSDSIFTVAAISDKQILIGGSYGIEGSIIATVFFAILGLLVYMGLYLKMFRRITKNK
ncbi:type II CAAX endopeptidase family protein [Gemella haemolysans]|uniref:CPBP family intramembrane glutamic endopeptidase n=1 Tax=Gemella haemolysans TaxID=1379 RepID=UPI00290EE1CA|nr:type II CAAX endopeptidase family protein [Gemella haemolysans]MDU3831127.1 type II CAAX endopeptidase family protein [Gemella haemolysans]